MMNHPPKRILVMRYRFIGDTLLTVPFLRNLRQAYPEAQIDMLVGPNSGEVLTHCPYLNELIYFDTTRKHRYENQTGQKQRSFWSYVKELKQRHYDTAFILKRSFSSAALAFLARIPNRIGFDTEGRRFLLTHAVPYDPTIHEVDSFLEILEARGIPITKRHLESWWSPQEEERVSQALQGYLGKQNLLLHLTSSNPAKQWMPERAKELAIWLIEEKNAVLHCLGAPSDAPLYETLKGQLPLNLQHRFHNWCGQFTLLESMAFLKHMALAIGVDSGTLHMAAAVGIPVIGLFGPMDERKWAPLGIQNQIITTPVSCRPCNLKKPCHHDYQCMTSLTVEKVQEACVTHWNS